MEVKPLLFSALHIDKWTWVLVMLLSWMTDRWVFLKLPFVFLLLGQQAYCRLYTCKKTKWWHDGSNPTSLLWGAFKLFLKNHKENCKSLGHPHHKYIYLNQSRTESKFLMRADCVSRSPHLPKCRSGGCCFPAFQFFCQISILVHFFLAGVLNASKQDSYVSES